MKNIFENAYFGKIYKTIDGREVIYCGTFDNDSKFNTKMVINIDPDQSSDYIHFIWYTQEGKASTSSEPQPDDIEDDYEKKLNSLLEACFYWEAYEDEPKLFAESLKELLDYAPTDQKTIDYCDYIIKSKKTIFDEVNKHITSLISLKPKEINEEELYNIADLWVGDNGVENSNDGIEAFIAGYNFAKKGE